MIVIVKKTKTLLLAFLISVIVMSLNLGTSFASHPLPEIDRFSTSHDNICYVINKLNTVHVNGQTNQGRLLESEVEDARVHISSRIDMTLAYLNSCTSGTSQISAKPMNANLNAMSTAMYGTGPYEYKIIYFNTHKKVNFDTSSICTAGNDPSPEFVANHEFGHHVGLGHAEWYDSQSHTMMKPNCGNGYASISSADRTQVNGYY